MRLLGDLAGARLDHDDRVVGAGDDQVDVGLVALGVGRVEDELAVDPADAHGADGRVERESSEQVSATEAPLMARMSGSFWPSAERTKAIDLRLVVEALREERAAWAGRSGGRSGSPSRSAGPRA